MTQQTVLADNPNSDKATTLNMLTGANQHVGNWPGVTVERKKGVAKKDKILIIQDLLGTYSLSPYTSEEIVARDYLLGDQPSVTLSILDTTNLEWSLYLITQLVETGLPVVCMLNMIDLLEKNGQTSDSEKLSYGLGVPVVEISVLKNHGLDHALKQSKQRTDVTETEVVCPSYDNRLEVALAKIADILGNTVPEMQQRWCSLKPFERDVRTKEQLLSSSFQEKEAEEAIQITEEIFQDENETIAINEHRAFIARLTALCATKKTEMTFTHSDKIDRVVTNRWFALPAFVFVAWLVYYLST